LVFQEDSDRYAVALLDAMLALEMGSERGCAVAVATWLVGVEFYGPHRPSAFAVTGWAINRTEARASAGTLEGKAATLRIKQRRCRSPAEGHWRKVMAEAFMLTIGARDQAAAKAAVLQRAGTIGEAEFALTVLWPMIDARFSGQFRIHDEVAALV
jgi:hypothetical protein